ncbi:GspH/FimT family pseudopilin [Stutzerimonas stutzeri]|uniref:GspH/FimT family pseudopilin n=1 Tax=Stutzerimonas stutzeri TaxID=316 RepID=UPI003D31B47F
METNRGFTLIELMIAIALIAIIAGIAIPNYRSSMQNTRETSARNSLVGALQLARSEAITRNITVTVTTAGSTWVINDGTDDIRVIEIPDGVAADNVAVTFQANGRPQATATIDIAGRDVRLNALGRASIVPPT